MQFIFTGFASGQRALLTAVDIQALCTIEGCAAGQLNTDPSAFANAVLEPGYVPADFVCRTYPDRDCPPPQTGQGLKAVVNGARVFLLAALVGMSLPAEDSQVSIQIVNPDASTSIRVFLDRKLIHEGTPARSSLSPNPTIPAVAGTFALDSTVRHVLTAEAPATHTKSSA